MLTLTERNEDKYTVLNLNKNKQTKAYIKFR